MNHSTKIESLVGALADHIGVGPVEFDENSGSAFNYEDTELVILPGGDEMICLFSSLLPVPHNDKEKADILDTVLRSNLYGAATSGAWFCIHDDQICLNTTLSLENLEFSSFKNGVDNFLGAVTEWKKKLGEHNDETASNSGKDNFGDSEMIRI